MPEVWYNGMVPAKLPERIITNVCMDRVKHAISPKGLNDYPVLPASYAQESRAAGKERVSGFE